MKVGELVKSKTNSIKAMIGIVLKIEEDFFKTFRSRVVDDRLTVYWAHGETTTEPASFVEIIAENKE